MKTITQAKLAVLLAEIKGATFASISYVGKDDAFNKTGLEEAHGFTKDQVEKHSQLNIFFGGATDYTKLVNKRLAKEGKTQITFESAGLQKNTEWLVDGILLENTNTKNVSLRTYPDVTNNVPKVHYEVNGKVIDPKESKFSPFWAKAFKDKQSGDFKEGKNQMLENSVKPRNYILSNIKEITFGGETYKIVG